jgi:opacity protein-like surface antigen
VGSQHNDVNKENVRATTGDPSFDQPDASDKNLFGQITAGYGHDFFRRFNVSANLFYNFGGGKVNDVTATFYQDSVKQELSNSRGFFLAPGYYANDRLLVFIKAGVVWSDQKYTRDTYGIALDHSIRGSLMGVGAKYALTKHVVIGADLTQYDYGTNPAAANLNGLDVTVSSKAKQINGLVSISYHF